MFQKEKGIAMKPFGKIVIAVIVIVIGLSTFAYAGGKKCAYCAKDDGCVMGYGKKDKRMDMEDKFAKKVHAIFAYAEKIDLTEKQKDDIIDLSLEMSKKLIRQKAEVKVILIDLKKELMKDALNIKQIDKLIEDKYEIKKNIAKGIAGSYKKVKDILSNEQKSMLKEEWSKDRGYKSKDKMKHKKMMNWHGSNY